jgi:hypothetical protein
MTAEQKTNGTRRMTGGMSVAPRGFASETRPSCVHSGLGLGQTAPGTDNSRPRQTLLQNAGCRPVKKSPEAAAQPAPIWMAALLATPCQAVASGEGHAVRWDCVSGRAIYTNQSSETEFIQPLGVRLEGGETLAVSWMPGETAYTLKVYNRKKQYLVA